MLTPLTAPETEDLLALATVRSLLGLTIDQVSDAALAAIISDASARVEQHLRFRAVYATWTETFRGWRRGRLYLGARPVWSVTSVTDYSGEVVDATLYRLENDAVFRSPGWRSRGLLDGSYVPPLIVTSGTSSAPDWTVVYTGGWWLEGMTGSAPAGVDTLPPAIRRDTLNIIRWMVSLDSTDPVVASYRAEGAEVRVRDLELDPVSGLPKLYTGGLNRYRRPL